MRGARARRKFDQLAKTGISAVDEDAIPSLAGVYGVERELVSLSKDGRRSGRQALALPLRKHQNA